MNFGKSTRALPALFVLAIATTAALVACAGSDEERTSEETPPGPDGGVTTLPEAAASDATADADAAPNDAGDVEEGPRTCSSDGFCYSTVPAGELLRGVWGDGVGVVWAVSATGDVLRWDGTAWKVHATGLGALSWISGTGPTDLWVVNKAGGVFHGTGASPTAITFAPVTLPGDATLLINAVWGTSPTDVWALGGKQSTRYPYAAAGKALHFDGSLDEGGAPVWTVDEDLSARPVMYTSAWGTPGGGVWLSGKSTYTSTTGNFLGTRQSSVIIRRAPGSSTWAEETIPFPTTNEPPAVLLCPVDPENIEALPPAGRANADGSVWLVGQTAFDSARFRWLGTTADNGQTYTWKPYAQFSWDLPVARGATGVWGMTANDSWEIGPYGRMAHWDGTAWKQAALMVTSAPLAKTFYAVWGTSSNDFWAVGDELAVHKTTANRP